MGGDGKPKPLNIPEAAPPPPASSRPKPLNLNDAQPASGAASTKPKPLTIPDQAPPPPAPDRAAHRLNIADAPPPAPAAPPRAPHALNIAEQIAPVRHERPRTIVDDLLDKAQQIDPSVRPERLKGRLDTILASSLTDMLDFGSRNLTPLQNVSGRQAKITAEMSRIDAAGWIEQTKDASCKRPGLLDRFTAKPPQYYEGMLQKARGELLAFVKELEQMKLTFFREITDLHLDALAMQVCAQVMTDPQVQITCDNRGRTLRQAHSTAAIVQTTIETALMQSAQYIQQIDQLLSVTLPAWKAANQP
jgi:hypothetical protein